MGKWCYYLLDLSYFQRSKNDFKMGPYCIVVALALAVASSDGESIFDPCSKTDLDCIGASVESFLRKTKDGKADPGYKPLDPFTMPEMEVINDDTMMFINTNNVITGFSGIKFSGLKVNMSALPAPVKVNMKVDIGMNCDTKFTLKKPNKNFSGKFKTTGTAMAKIEYVLGMKEVDGKMFFVVGQENAKCEFPEEPTYSFSDDMVKALEADPDFVKMNTESPVPKSRYTIDPLTRICKAGTALVFHNIRTLAANYPKETFFTDL